MWPNRRLIDLLKIEFPILQAPMIGPVDTVLIQRRSAHPYSALQGLAACLKQDSAVIAA